MAIRKITAPARAHATRIRRSLMTISPPAEWAYSTTVAAIVSSGSGEFAAARGAASLWTAARARWYKRRMPARQVRVSFCGLPCTDLTLDDAPDGSWRVGGGCASGREALAAAAAADLSAAARVAGRAATMEEAIDAAAGILARARSPFVYGLSHSSMESARQAARLARALRGAIDVEGSAALDAEHQAMAAHGLCAATFGEIRTRADLVLLFRCDPRAEHPALLPPDAAIIELPPRGRTGEGSASPAGDLEVVLALRAAVAGAPVRALPSGSMTSGALQDIARALRSARFAALLWDPAALGGPDGPAVASALILLTRDLNEGGRAVARPLGAGGNVAGATSALLAVGGAPRALGFPAGAPEASSESFSAAAMLAGGADVLLLVGARRLSATPAGASRIVVGAAPPAACAAPEVFLPAAAVGFDGGGLYLRADGVPVPIRPAISSGRWQEETILATLGARLAGSAP
jgi:formylmethanofuran dehydrogenase subunit B